MQEWARMLLEIFSEQVVLLDTFPRTRIDVRVEVLGAEGGVLTACANAISLALIDAGIAMRDYLVASSSVFYPGQRGPNGLTTGTAIVVDPSRNEETAAGSGIMRAFFLGHSGRPVALTTEHRLPAQRFDEMQEAIAAAVPQIFHILNDEIVGKHAIQQRIHSINANTPEDEDEEMPMVVASS